MAITSPATASAGGERRPRATIGRKLTAIFVGIALVFGTVCLVSYRAVGNLAENSAMVEHTYQVLDQLEVLGSSLKDAETGQRGYLITGEDAYLEPYTTATAALTAEQQTLRGLTADNPRQQDRLDQLAPLVEAKLAEMQETIDLRRTEGFAAARKVVLTDQGKAVMDQIRTLTDAMASEESSLLGARRDAADSSERQAQLTIVVGLVVLLAGMAVAGTAITRQTSRRVSRMRVAITALARGDLTARTGLSGDDEFGVMGQDLDSAVGTIRHTVGDLAATATSLSAASVELSKVSTSLSTGAEEASGQATRAAYAADEINSNVQSVATGAEEMTASIREIAGTSSQADQVANESLQIARSTSSQISELGEASTQIGDVVRLITQIAEQTNLLALNATIEAARAGDAGKGFAVVASEVKDLAQETARATEDITRRISAIQVSSQGAGTAVQRIEEVIGQMTEFSSTIAAAVEEQSATTNEMTRSISDAARASGDVQANFTAVAQVTTATATSAQASQAAADDMSGLAVKLNSMVAKFNY